MDERMPWEIPPFMTVEEIADLTGMSVRAVKYNKTRRGWGFGVGADSKTYIDLRTVDCGMGNLIFDCIVMHDNAAHPLQDVVRTEVLEFLESLARTRLNRDYAPFYIPAAMLCRCLEILQAAQRNLYGMHLPSASVGLSQCIDVDPDMLQDMLAGKTFYAPILDIPKRYWMTLLLEWAFGVAAAGREAASLEEEERKEEQAAPVTKTTKTGRKRARKRAPVTVEDIVLQ